MLQKLRQISIKRILRTLGFIVVGITIAAFWVFAYLFANMFYFSDNESAALTQEEQDTYRPFSTEGCNVAGINLHGQLFTYTTGAEDETASEDIVFAVQAAEEADNIKAILLDIDSPGGYAVAADEVMNALKNSKKPTVAMIREYGDSAAYWAATGADIIFASALSDVGSIGVTGSYLQNVKYDQKEGYEFINLSTGKFKDVGNPDKPITEEEKNLIMRDFQKIHEVFVESVAENRKLKIEQVNALADGSTMLGDAALKKGLIDRIGSYQEVKQYLKEKIGEPVSVCW